MPGRKQGDRPNIVIIVADQLSQQVIGAYGSEYGITGAVDSIAASGVAFAKAYTPYPLCMPARSAFWTGRYPHEAGVESNELDEVAFRGELTTLGDLLSGAGYACIHFGKLHDSGALRGFTIGEDGTSAVEATPPWPVYHHTAADRFRTEQTVKFLRQPHHKPFCVVADLDNPHDICFWIHDHAGPHDDEPVPGDLPELPANFGSSTMRDTKGWTPENYRYYLAAYHHYTDMMNREVTSILEAVRARGDAAPTIVVFLADHGEAMAAHGLVLKGGHFYEECARVPFMIGGYGVDRPGRLESSCLVSTLDLVPTLCELTGIEPPAGLPGSSLVPWLKGEHADGPDYVVSACLFGGRMVRTQRYKYCFYKRKNGEQLFDLEADPGELRDLAGSPDHAAVLQRHRSLLERYCRQTGDPIRIAGERQTVRPADARKPPPAGPVAPSGA